jgi:hypothetical protein
LELLLTPVVAAGLPLSEHSRAKCSAAAFDTAVHKKNDASNAAESAQKSPSNRSNRSSADNQKTEADAAAAQYEH